MVTDFLIVGSGLFGAVFAQQCKEHGKSCLVIDKRSHIAGNVYSEKVEDIDVHKYGPHCFNTNNDKIWEYANRFSKFNQYAHKVKVNHSGKIYSFPINLDTFKEVYGITLPSEAVAKMEEVRIKIDDPKNLEEWCLSQIGPEFYELFIRGYTTKQWKKSPTELPAEIIKRIPVRYSYDDRYHDKRWSGIPSDGYTAWVANMLDGVKVELGMDFFKMDWRRYAKRVIYTGKIDELYGYCYGELEYRTLRFEDKIFNGDFQGVAQVNYTDERVPHTRVTEHKHFNNRNQPKTVATWEFPEEWTREATPYYPINTSQNNETYTKYKKISGEGDPISLGGRLATYRYMDMDAVIGSSLLAARQLLE